MAYDIEKYPAQSGRVIAEDGTIHNLVDLLQGNGGGGGGTQDVKVQNLPKWKSVGNILSGSVDPESQPKLIEAAGADAIEIQCPQDNTGPLLVSNMEMDFGDWEVHPGTSKTFYYNTLYVRTTAAEAQKVVFMAWSFS